MSSETLKEFKIKEYIIEKKIGGGAYGNTYLAKKDGKLYVLKETILNSTGNKDEKVISNFIKENKDKWSENNNLFHYIEYFDDENQAKAYFVSEYIGITLRDYLNNNHKLWEINEIIDFAKQILISLSLLHSYSIYHRDLKPENICIKDENNQRKYIIIDYGSGIKTKNEEENKVTKDVYKNRPFGTSRYLHPKINEIYYCGESQEINNKNIDIWSLGLICLELFTGEQMFKYEKFIKNEEINNNEEIQKKNEEIKKNNQNLAKEEYYTIPFIKDKTTVEFVEFIDCMLQYNPSNQLDTRGLLDLYFLKDNQNQKDFKIFPIDDEKNEDNYVKEGDKEFLKLNFRKKLNFDYDKLLNKQKKVESKDELTKKILIALYEEELFTEPVLIPLIKTEDGLNNENNK